MNNDPNNPFSPTNQDHYDDPFGDKLPELDYNDEPDYE